jgi:hypothetical protein
MSDIGFPGLENLMIAIYALMIVAPSLVLGGLLLILRAYVPTKLRLWIVLYWVTSISVIIAEQWGWSIWLNDPESFTYAVPIAVSSTAIVFVLYSLLRRVLGLIR